MSRLSSFDAASDEPTVCGESRFFGAAPGESGNNANESCSGTPRCRDGMKRSLYCGLRAEEGRLRGALLDAFPEEPLPADNPLWTHPRVLITPHMAWYSEDAAQELKRKVAEEAVRFASGEKVLWPVNRPKA